MARTSEIAIAQSAAEYPLGSVWHHNSLGPVEVVGHDVYQSPPNSYCGVTYGATPRIRDRAGREYSCYAPHHDLRHTP